jgi:hypothetical protein
MNFVTVSLFTDQPPLVRLAGDDLTIPNINFAVGLDVALPASMGSEGHAKWCLDFAADLVELAGQLKPNATVAS